MIRVLHVIGRMPGHGTERQLAGMLRAAHGKQWDATLCVLRSGDALTAELAADGVPVLEADFGSDSDPRRLLWLRSKFKGFDVVHSSLAGPNMYVQMAALTKKAGRPAVVVSERNAGGDRSTLQSRVHSMARGVTDYYLGNSNDVVPYIEKVHGVHRNRIGMIKNGIDTSVFNLGRRVPNTTDVIRIGAVGRLKEQKGHDLLIKSLPEILKYQNVSVHIAGQGPLEAELRAAAAGLPVVFEGFLDSPAKVADFLGSLDLFAMPSRFEGLPNALLEAIACGTPVVATDVPGMKEATGGQVPLVEPGNADALAEGIVKALSDPKVPDITISSFDDVARMHKEAFEHAIRLHKGETSVAPASIAAL